LTNERNARKMFEPIINLIFLSLNTIIKEFDVMWCINLKHFVMIFFIIFWNEIKRLILTYFKSHKNRLISVLIVVIRTLYMHGLYNNNQFRVKTKKTIEMYKPCHVWLILCWLMDVFTWRPVASQLVEKTNIFWWILNILL
jgi:hypothetical protein